VGIFPRSVVFGSSPEREEVIGARASTEGAEFSSRAFSAANELQSVHL
jgi:hypothetical protein